MADIAVLRAAYDAQTWMPSAAVPAGVTYEHDGPLVRIVGGHVGRIRAPRDLGVSGVALDRLVAGQRDYFQSRGEGVEWKVRGGDLPVDLPERLGAAGFVPESYPPSVVLVGVAAEVAVEPVLPEGVTLRQTSHVFRCQVVGCKWAQAMVSL